MENQPIQPVDRNTIPRAGTRSLSDGNRRGWLPRFGRNVIERKLDTAMQRLVRQEKYTSALIVSFRIARELEKPLGNLERHIAVLDRLAEREPEIRQVAASLRRDRRAILRAIQRLREIEPPVGAAA